MGWQPAREISDHAVSGQTRHRIGHSELLHLVQSRAIDVIVVESLSRDAVDLPDLFRQCEFHRVEIHAVDKGRVRRTDIGAAGLVNPIQLEQIALRTHRTLEHQVVAEGKSADGLSYVYRVPVGADGLRVKGDIVLRILRQYVEGRTPREIAHGLNRDGIAPPHSGKPKKETRWTQNTINGIRERGTGILNNPLYVGRRVWSRHDWVRHPESRNRLGQPRDPSDYVHADVPIFVLSLRTCGSRSRVVRRRRTPCVRNARRRTRTASPPAKPCDGPNTCLRASPTVTAAGLA